MCKKLNENSKKPQAIFSECYTAFGHLTNNNSVTHALPNEEMIEIRIANSGLKNLNLEECEPLSGQSRLHKVTYNIGFTFGEPLAYNVQVCIFVSKMFGEIKVQSLRK